MTGYLVRRFGQMLLTLFMIISLAFFLVQAQPGDYTSTYAQNPDLPPEVRAQIQASFGLDKSLGEQYLLHIYGGWTLKADCYLITNGMTSAVVIK